MDPAVTHQQVKVTPIYYACYVVCTEGTCDFSTHGPDARIQAITHTQGTGHGTIVRVEQTEEIRPR